MIFFNQRVTPLLAPTLTSHLHLRRSETPLETNSGYATENCNFVNRYGEIRSQIIQKWGQPSIYFPIDDHVNVSRCRSHTNASGVISTSHIVASHITKLLLSFRQILQFRFRDNPQGRIPP